MRNKTGRLKKEIDKGIRIIMSKNLMMKDWREDLKFQF